MEEGQLSKKDIRESVIKRLDRMSADELAEKYKKIEERLFGFANFLESRIVLFYMDKPGAVSYTHLTLPTRSCQCRSRWSPYH